MGEVIRRLEACRSSAVGAEEARSGLQRFAATVVLKRALPGTEPGTSVFAQEQPARDRFDPEQNLEDLVLDYQSEVRPASPVAPTAIMKPPPPSKRRHLAALLAIGAITLLAIIGLSIFLFTRGVDRPTPVAPSPRPAPQSFSTFDVATLYSPHGYDKLESSVDTIAVTADGKHALIGSWTDRAELINVDEARPSRLILGLDDNWQGGWPVCASITPDGRRAMIGTLAVIKSNARRARAKEGAGILWFWDLTTGREYLPKKQPYDTDVYAVAISRDGLRGLSASKKGELTLWDLTTGDQVRSLGPQKGVISPRGMAIFPDGHRAATAGHDQLVHIWDLDTGAELAAWEGHIKGIPGLAISNDGSRIVTGGDDGRVILWDVASGTILHRFEMPPNDTGARVAFDSEGNIVAAGFGVDGSPARPGNLIVWDAKTFAELRRNERPIARHLALAALPDGRLLTGDRYALRIWTPRQPVEDPAKPPAGANRDASPVNLLALIQPETHKISGEWLKTGDGALLSPSSGLSRLRVPYDLPLEYRVEMEVEHTAKGDRGTLGLYFVVSGRQAHIMIDKPLEEHGPCTGLDGLDGIPVSLNPKAHRGQLLTPSRPARLVLTVRRGSIHLTCDGASVVDWKGDPKRLIRSLAWHLPDTKDFIFSTTSSYSIREITITPLTTVTP